MAYGLVGRQNVAVLSVLVAFLACQTARAAISLDPVPPFQWLNITSLLTGTTKPPSLYQASIGYDEASRSLIIFGGEASSGVPQSQTYLLNLDSLAWSIPTPPATLEQTPPARSAAVSGIDSAASNRNGFLVIGGKGMSGEALSDVWEFDWTNQFWHEVNISPGPSPSARWGSSGGIDIRVPPVADAVLPGPNNTFWLLGGQDSQNSFSDLWRLNISGTLSSNLPDDVEGSWEEISLKDFPGSVGQGGGVIFQQIVTSGGCNDTLIPAESCTVQNAYVITSTRDTGTVAPALDCPAPRLSPTLIPNGNAFSTSFSSQMLLLFGTFNSSLWDDGGGMKDGEVAVLDVNTQSWTRVLPSGDPGTSGTPSFPTPREGAVAVMYPQSLIGDSRKISSDIIVFGGRDASGNYLSDLWLLRAYNGLVNTTQLKWSGFGNGQLQTGANANGAGVENTFVDSCALPIAPPPTSSTTNSTSTSTSSGPGGSPTGGGGSPQNKTGSQPSLNTSLLHKLFAPLSLALLLPAFLLFRLTSLSFNSSHHAALPRIWYYVSGFLGVAGYGLGIAGIATSFTTISTPDGARPSPLGTAHGRAGLALFICLYGLLILLAILHISTKRTKHELVAGVEESRKRADSDVTEKDQLPRSAQTPSPALSVRRRTHSWGPSSWRKVREDSLSIDSGSGEMGDTTPPTQRTFEVLNRPARTRRGSGSRLGVPLTNITHPNGSHSLGDLDWLNRRRSLTAVGELDYPLDHSTPTATLAPPPSTPGTLLDPPVPVEAPSNMPPTTSIILRLLFHASLAAFCVFCLVTLWSKKAPKSTFGVFLAWTVAFYVILIGSSWRGRPDRSTLSLLFGRLRTQPAVRPTAPRPSVSDTLPDTDDNLSFPYTHHRPAYRRALLSDAVGPQSTDTEEEDDDRAEDEMRRRDISIVTSYPKRALRITNPS
ncbi:hypothetical protein MSAN_01447100 [Mycena sanguinolenta]|uniref:Galactose oxidase n=1 Tax=Mycena sanguinolenta TaxID=230812 RepID=A0A8H6Y9X7_9AGAR|nr:hypothetical protein MSAN_01447100 [Mycena sanguinolenta]